MLLSLLVLLLSSLLRYCFCWTKVTILTDRISTEGNAFGSVRPFVFTLVFEPTDLRPWPFACHDRSSPAIEGQSLYAVGGTLSEGTCSFFRCRFSSLISELYFMFCTYTAFSHVPALCLLLVVTDFSRADWMLAAVICTHHNCCFTILTWYSSVCLSVVPVTV